MSVLGSFGFAKSQLSDSLLALVFMIIPIAGPIALGGWFAEMMQRMVRRHPRPLPKISFDDFGHYLARGVPTFVVSFAFAFVFYFVAMFAMFIGGFSGGVMAAVTHEPALSMVGFAFGGLLLMVVLAFAGPVLEAAVLRAELSEDIGEALSPAKVWPMARKIFWRVLVKNIVFSFVAVGCALLGLLVCFVGVYIAAIVIRIAGAHLRGQVYLEYVANGGEPVPLKPVQVLPSEARG